MKLDDIRVKGYCPLMEPQQLKETLKPSSTANQTVLNGRQEIEDILSRKGKKKLLAIVGPCSIHDEKAAEEYRDKLYVLHQRYISDLLIVMRVYFEKPRTSVGWKGLINDPDLNGTNNVRKGLKKARRILLGLAELGLPAATEFLETITPQYVADLVSWACIGARTTESQAHREMASGLSMPVGFKNGTNGCLDKAINAIIAARAPQSFLGVDNTGKTCVVKTSGNPWTHIVLRGGEEGPNYFPKDISRAAYKLAKKNLPLNIMVDCSHDNSFKKSEKQEIALQNIVEQKKGGEDSIFGIMLESNLCAGSQSLKGNPDLLKYGVSITDGCMSIDTTDRLLDWTCNQLQ